MARKKKQKHYRVTIIADFWNCSYTKRFIGKKGTISHAEHTSYLDIKTVMINDRAINFHKNELKVNAKP